MDNGDLSPLMVTTYDKDVLVELIRNKTGSDLRSQVSGKAQLSYLDHYLREDHIQAKTIVVEDRYVDRHFIEDYSEYYARCFSSYPKNCSRAHFFAETFTELEFRDALKKDCKEFIEKLKKSYLGYVVIRPVPNAFFARVCIKPYTPLVSSPNCKLIRKRHDVSLFGINLSIETTAFIEQDKVVAACATSALWTLLSASGEGVTVSLPSPSAITKAAFLGVNEGGRTFPTSGLTTDQVARSLKHFGLEPSLLSIGKTLDELKATIFAYVSNDIPVLIGGDIYRASDKGDEPEFLGAHFVCVLGFHLGDDGMAVDGGIIDRADAIDKIYVHDDRYGPYVRLGINKKPLKVKEKEEDRPCLVFSLRDQLTEYFIPDVMVIGHYHKIRIPYSNIWGVADGLHSLLKVFSASIEAAALLPTPDAGDQVSIDRRAYDESVNKALKSLIDGTWEISLIKSNDLKVDTLAHKSFLVFNGAPDKTTLLMQNMPKYLWRCRIVVGQEKVTDVIFDATEIPQGAMMVGHITYALDYEQMWQAVGAWISSRAWEELTGILKEKISPILTFFNKLGRSAVLNTLYGPLRLPNRRLKHGEKDKYENITRQNATVIRRGKEDWTLLNNQKKYIWVIDELGDLVIGEDIETDGVSQGHPTLTDGRPARLGGELMFKDGFWTANLKSGTYAAHIDAASAEGKTYLQNVIENNFSKLQPKPDESVASKARLAD